MVEAPLPTGLGDYEIVRRLASGGVAEVFLAEGRVSPMTVAIKCLLPSVARNGELVAALVREAEVIASLHHENVVSMIALESPSDQPRLVMEWVDGSDLRAIFGAMSRRGLREMPLACALGIVDGVLGALEHVHESRLRVVHRDVSPPNVMLRRDGVVKLVDFGMAKSTLSNDEGLGRVQGKAAYMSPEQARGEIVDARSDLFSVGTLLYELTTSRRLFVGATEYETLRLVADREAPLPRTIVPSYLPALERIVMRALARDRDARYPTATAMKNDLDALARGHGIDRAPDLVRFAHTIFASGS